jgi:hypothetical protein
MEPELASDLLHGAQAIGEVLYGPNHRHAARKVYNNQDRLPVFKLEGSTILLALRSRLTAHLHAKSSEKEERIAATTTTKPVAAIKAAPKRRRQVQRTISPNAAA